MPANRAAMRSRSSAAAATSSVGRARWRRASRSRRAWRRPAGASRAGPASADRGPAPATAGRGGHRPGRRRRRVPGRSSRRSPDRRTTAGVSCRTERRSGSGVGSHPAPSPLGRAACRGPSWTEPPKAPIRLAAGGSVRPRELTPRSTTTGAWSLGAPPAALPLGLRSVRSIVTCSSRSTSGRVPSIRSMRMPMPLWKLPPR